MVYRGTFMVLAAVSMLTWQPWKELPGSFVGLSYQTPGRGSPAILRDRHFVQVVTGFRSVQAPPAVNAAGTISFPEGARVYTADPLVEERYRRDVPRIVRVRTDADVLRLLRRQPEALGIINVESVRPQWRALTPPVPVQRWLVARRGVPAWMLRLTGMSADDIQPVPRFTTLAAVGDLMLGRRVGARMAREPESRYPFGRVVAAFRGADIVTGNLECALSGRGQAVPGKDYTFRAAPEAIRRLQAAGFTILDLANNHSKDYGGEALADTLRLLKGAGIMAVGAGRTLSEAKHAQIVPSRDGRKIGFLAYSAVLPEGFSAQAREPGVAPVVEERLGHDIRVARPLCDLLIVQFHWGDQYRDHSNARQKRLAHIAVDAGADVVIGHHPHWLQELEFYKGKPIAYSLGNFVFDMDHRPKVREGAILRCIFEGLTLRQVALEPIEIKDGQPEPIPWGLSRPRNRETILKEVLDGSRGY